MGITIMLLLLLLMNKRLGSTDKSASGGGVLCGLCVRILDTVNVRFIHNDESVC